MYNSTPDSTTGVAPSALMFGRVLRDKLPGFPSVGMKSIEEVKDKDRERKIKGGEYAHGKRNAKPNPVKQGDVVVTKQTFKENKLASNFNPEEFTVLDRAGPDVKLKSTESGKIYHRNVSHLKPVVWNNDRTMEKTPSQKDAQTIPTQLTGPSQGVDNLETVPVSLSKEQPKERPRREIKRPEYLGDYLLRVVQDY